MAEEKTASPVGKALDLIKQGKSICVLSGWNSATIKAVDEYLAKIPVQFDIGCLPKGRLDSFGRPTSVTTGSFHHTSSDDYHYRDDVHVIKPASGEDKRMLVRHHARNPLVYDNAETVVANLAWLHKHYGYQVIVDTSVCDPQFLEAFKALNVPMQIIATWTHKHWAPRPTLTGSTLSVFERIYIDNECE